MANTLTRPRRRTGRLRDQRTASLPFPAPTSPATDSSTGSP